MTNTIWCPHVECADLHLIGVFLFYFQFRHLKMSPCAIRTSDFSIYFDISEISKRLINQKQSHIN